MFDYLEYLNDKVVLTQEEYRALYQKAFNAGFDAAQRKEAGEAELERRNAEFLADIEGIDGLTDEELFDLSWMQRPERLAYLAKRGTDIHSFNHAPLLRVKQDKKPEVVGGCRI